MSLDFLKWAFDQDIENPGVKMVLVVIANWANPINPCDKELIKIVPDALQPHIPFLGFSWPSQKLLREKCSSRFFPMGDRTLRRHLSDLEEMGLIVTFERRRPDGRKSSDGYLLITSPVILAADTSPAKNDETSPAKLAGTYEDTQGLIHKRELETPPIPELSKPPLPPVAPHRWTSQLTGKEWRVVQAAAVTKGGAQMSVKYLADQYEEWARDPKNHPRNVLNHFLSFIEGHKRRNKL